MEVVPFEQIADAEQILKRIGLSGGMAFADFGVGRQAPFTFAAAHIVSATGRVYILDVVKDVLALMKSKTDAQGLKQVISVWTDLELYGAARQVPDGTVDVGVLSDTLFQSENKPGMVKECMRMLKHGGTLLMVDWKTESTVLGPPQEHRVSAQQMKEIAAQCGLRQTDEFEAGEYHWAVVFQK